MAAEEIGELLVKIEADISDFSKKLDTAVTGIETAQKKASGAGQVIKNMFSFAGGFAIFETIKKGFEESVVAGAKFDSTMQQNKIAFDTMLGSAEKTDKLLNQLSTLAASTPFEFPELAKSAKSLSAFGVDAGDITDKLRRIGDIAAGVGAPVGDLAEIFGKAKVQGRLFAEDINQLTGRGIPIIQELAKQFGVTESKVKELVEDGKVGFPELDKAFNSLTNTGGKFAGMMDAQSKSFQGLGSTLKDNVQMTFGKVLEPAFNWLTTTGLPAAINLTNQFSAAFQSGGLAAGFKTIFPPEIVDTVQSISLAAGSLFGMLINNFNTVLTVVTAVTGGFLAYKTMVIGTTVVQEIMNAALVANALATGGITAAQTVMASSTGAATAAQWLLNAAMSANPIGIVVVALGALTAAIIYLWNTNEDFRNALTSAWDSIKNAFISVYNWVDGNWGNLLLLLTNPIGAALKFLYDTNPKFKEWVDGVWNAIVDTFKELPGKIGEFFNELPEKIGYALGLALGTIAKWGIDITNWIITEVPKFISKIGAFFNELPGNIAEYLSNVVTRLNSWVTNMISTAQTEVPKIISTITGFFSNLPSEMLTVGDNLVKGLWNGINNSASWLQSKIKEFSAGIIKGIKESLGIHSPSRIMRDQVGVMLGAGMAEGINDSMNMVSSAMDDLSNTVSFQSPAITASQGASTLLDSNSASATSTSNAATQSAQQTNTAETINISVVSQLDGKTVSKEMSPYQYSLTRARERGLGTGVAF